MRLRLILWVFGGLASVLALLVGAGYLVLLNMDFAELRPQLVAQVERATGRSFEIGERIEVGLNNGLVIRATDLALGNPDWSSKPKLLTVGQVEARVGLLPLLSGQLEIRHLDLHRVSLVLEAGPDGQPNWMLGTGPDEGGGIDVALRSFEVKSGALRWHTAVSSTPPAFSIDDLNLKGLIDGNAIAADGTGILNGTSIGLATEIGLPELGQPAQAVRLTLKLLDGGGVLEANGTIAETEYGLVPELMLGGRRIQLSELGRLTGQDLPTLPPLDLSAEIGRDSEGWMVVDPLTLKTPRSNLSGRLSVQAGAERPKITANLRAERLDLLEFIQPDNAEPHTPTEATAESSLFSSTDFQLPPLDSVDAQLDVSAKRMEHGGRPMQQAALAAKLQR